jgi:predicted small lipoprotein YifL
MKKRTIWIAVGAALMSLAGLALPACGQTSPLPLPPAVEKELAARASNVTEVTLGKNMLSFAAKFMNGKDEDEAATRRLIENLDGIYVRAYEFDKEGQYSMEEIEKLRSYFATSEWTPIVHSRERKSGETTDVLLKLVNGETRGMFVLSCEPRELSIVLILGPVRMEDLSRLKGIGGLGALGDIQSTPKAKEKTKEQDKEKDKTKGGTE